MEQRRQGRQRASECIRKQKRKELDARRSKCRIRIGGHLEQWCQLKEQLGFSLHSQLAKYLIDRYTSQGCVLSAGQGGSDPSALPTDALQHLVVLSHVHSQECSFIPNVKTPSPGDKGAPGSLVWECMAGHTFSWGPSALEEQGCAPPGDSSQPGKAASRRKKERGASSESSPLPSPVTSRRRSLRRAALAQDSSGTMVKVEPNPLGDSGVVERMAAPSSTSSMDHGGELGAGSSDTDAAPLPTEAEAGMEGIEPESAPGLEDKSEEVPEPKEDEDEDFTEEDDLTYTDDLRDENYHPSLDSDSELKREQSQTKSCKRPMKAAQLPTETSPANGSPSEEKVVQSSRKKRGQPSDKDVAQIGPKRIRKATKREMLLCDFEGCGKIFSNRQYLNHHKKYQHVHQKTFTCSEPSCGKSFNFKKHLKEHEKLHSDKRDYICEYCARPFRTSSNLIIHRRIHTGEKPIQCEICGFTCRQKASLNWHMKKHDADSFYQFSCDICGKKFEKKDNVTAHKSKSHPEVAAGPAQPTLEMPEPGHQDVPSPLPTLAEETPTEDHPDVPCPLATEQLEIPALSLCKMEKAEGPVSSIAASAE
uniref:Zinc finger protein 692 n=1 Tax=Chrysemys picta bellii TaxID=8478 RepID=A0A8C3F5S8_CHRPI|nr:zinc finger protein 692 [Chrysemys picta bellii]XP_005312477.1 zinc finger protein 692 [Chrysemys picta bellii]XP_008174547.1 zinc finger protein 692 [Chrysemys picta bellii]XP_023968559.1 zinc finger protein 692 [Chrysemys picta bellii]